MQVIAELQFYFWQLKNIWIELSGEHKLLCIIFQNVDFSSNYLKAIIWLFLRKFLVSKQWIPGKVILEVEVWVCLWGGDCRTTFFLLHYPDWTLEEKQASCWKKNPQNPQQNISLSTKYWFILKIISAITHFCQTFPVTCHWLNWFIPSSVWLYQINFPYLGSVYWEWTCADS